MFGFIKKMFIVLLTGVVDVPNQTKCVSLSNQPCMIKPTLIYLNFNEYKQGFCYYLFTVNLDRYNGSCNTCNNISVKLCVPNKTEDVNLNVFNLITRTNESKTLIKHISCKFKCTFNSKKCNSNLIWNNNKFPRQVCEKGYIWNPATCSCENSRYAKNIIDDLEFTCDETIETTKSIMTKTFLPSFLTNFNEEKVICKMKNVYILLAFLFITRSHQ